MHLTELNKQDIINVFGSLCAFNIAMSFAISRLHGRDKLMMQNIKIYYNNCFDMPVNMVDDIFNLYDMALMTIERTKALCDKNPLCVYRFIFERVEKNILYVQQIKKLA